MPVAGGLTGANSEQVFECHRHISGILGSQYIGLQAGGSPVYLEDGSELYFTQSAVILENLIGKFLVRGGSDEEGEDE